MDMEKAQEATALVIGDAVIQLISDGRDVSRESIADMVSMMAGDEPDLAVEFSLDLLR